MQIRSISFFSAAYFNLATTSSRRKIGHTILDSRSSLLLLDFAWEQKPQSAVHLVGWYVSKYIVVGLAFDIPLVNPNIMADPMETLTEEGTIASATHDTLFFIVT